MQTTHLALTFTPYDRLLDWLKVTGLPIALTVLGAVILARFVNWAGGRITQRIDDNTSRAMRWCGPRRPSTGTPWHRSSPGWSSRSST
ncbi:hypothetical protein GS943_24475 [Rhodococcus hoagii]|nr:hypothetical protein [Prescottella equi]